MFHNFWYFLCLLLICCTWEKWVVGHSGQPMFRLSLGIVGPLFESNRTFRPERFKVNYNEIRSVFMIYLKNRKIFNTQLINCFHLFWLYSLFLIENKNKYHKMTKKMCNFFIYMYAMEMTIRVISYKKKLNKLHIFTKDSQMYLLTYMYKCM